MIFQYPQNLITEIIQCFKEEDDLDITPEQANEYLNSLAGLFLAFAHKRSVSSPSGTDGELEVDEEVNYILGTSNT